MRSILDQIADQQTSRFCPNSIREFFALRLAQKLGDSVAVRHYLRLIEQRSEEQVLVAYRRAVSSSKPENWARAFHSALEHVNGNAPGLPSSSLLAIKIERRTVSVALFAGTHVEYTQTHHLSSAREKAEASAASFVNSMLHHFDIDAATLEQISTGEEIQRLILRRAISSALRNRSVSVWEIEKRTLLAGFGHPTPRSRREMRESVSTIWPVLSSDGGILDATALGLYIQTERLFSYEI